MSTLHLCTAVAALAGLAAAARADIDSYSVGYQLNYRQIDATQVEFFACSFFTAVNGHDGDATAATFTSGLSGNTYDMIEVVPGVFQGGVLYTDTADLFAEFPVSDTYTLAISGGALGAMDGDVSPPDPLNLPDTIPQFDPAQFAEYQSIDGLNDYTFRYNTFASTGNLEQVYLVIDAYPSSRRVHLSILEAGDGQATIPAGTLRLNRRFTATLYFLSFEQVEGAGFGSARSSVAAWRTNGIQIRTAGNCPPDFSGDGFLDFFDYMEFVEAFETGDPDADFNGDGFTDFFDYSDFVAGFEGGC